MSEFELMVLKIAANAIKTAQEKNLKNGQSFFQLPDGTITQEEPQQYKDVLLK